MPDWTGALARAEAHAPFLARLIAREDKLAALLAAGEGEAALATARAAGADAPDLGTALRRERRALALALAVGDLAGAFPLARVMGELSDLADRALDAAIAEALTRRDPGGGPRGFLALALGKHGAQELNYSSDIDPILLYDPALIPHRASEEPGEAAARIAREVVQTLSRIDGEGYVFRVDLRLRPASEVSPPALPIEAALSHYESAALAWERAAFIRARAAAGDVAAGEGFLAAIRPFVWRKSLDFGAIAEIGRLTLRIRAENEGPARPGPGFDLKRGRGGIREIEFFAQTHQLIHGGRNPELRQRGTRASLDALAGAGIIDPADAALLGASYDRLRTLEHRLQMVRDQQTHALPGDKAALDAVAALDGLTSGKALVAELAAITEAVAARYDGLIARVSEAPASAPAQVPLARLLADQGWPDPGAVAARIAGWRDGKLRALRSEAARAGFDAILPDLSAALAEAPEPLTALARFEDLLARLPSALTLFELLGARPALLATLGRVLSLAPPLADALATRADLLDSLIDATAFDLPGAVAALKAGLARGEADDDYQRVLDRVRRRVGEWRFAAGVQLLQASHDPLEIGAGLARVAEAALGVLADATVAQFAEAHGRVPGGELVVLALGRFGGGRLTPASDLDLVYLFTGDHSAESDGPRPLGATLYFNRLAQRLGAALSVPTAEGALYEVDTRLRPSGAQGPLAVSLESFARYQAAEAWTWEHMALARARAVYGSEAARATLEAAIAGVLAAPRDRAKLKADVLAMRRDIAAHKPAKGPLDVKLARGGLVDCEFVVHFLQLREAQALTPDLGAAIAALAGAGLVDPALGAAHASLTRFLVAARLLAPDSAPPGTEARAALAKACGARDWDDLTATLAAARAAVARAWAGAFGESLET